MELNQRIPFNGYWFKVTAADDKTGIYTLERQEQTTSSLKKMDKFLQKLVDKRKLK